jgi:hypothetical protein
MNIAGFDELNGNILRAFVGFARACCQHRQNDKYVKVPDLHSKLFCG